MIYTHAGIHILYDAQIHKNASENLTKNPNPRVPRKPLDRARVSFKVSVSIIMHALYTCSMQKLINGNEMVDIIRQQLA